jgi:hypothetical protein
MRLTTSSSVTLATAGLAAVVTGCSSGHTASSPVVANHATQAAPVAAKPAAAPANPKAELAQAVRASLAKHTVQFRYQVSQVLVKPDPGQNDNPLLTQAGVLNFDRDLVTVNETEGAHSNTPYLPVVSLVVDGESLFGGFNADVINSGTWAKESASSGDSADVQITQVLQDVKGPVTVVKKTRTTTEYRLQANLSQLITDQSDGTDPSAADEFAGTTQTEYVWVNQDGLVTRALWSIDPGRVHASGLDPSVVKRVYVMVEFANYGVDMVVPPHPTS